MQPCVGISDRGPTQPPFDITKVTDVRYVTATINDKPAAEIMLRQRLSNLVFPRPVDDHVGLLRCCTVYLHFRSGQITRLPFRKRNRGVPVCLLMFPIPPVPLSTFSLFTRTREEKNAVGATFRCAQLLSANVNSLTLSSLYLARYCPVWPLDWKGRRGVALVAMSVD